MAQSLLRKLAEEFPQLAAYRRDLALAQRAVAGMELKNGQNEAARRDLGESIDLLEQLAKEFPDDQEYALELAASRRAWNEAFEAGRPEAL
jgi:hypothetical protein